jgi:hypothetical protein
VNPLKIKIPVKNIGKQLFAEGFNSSVKRLRGLVNVAEQWRHESCCGFIQGKGKGKAIPL